MRSPLINELLESQLKTLLERVSAPVALTCVAGESEKDAEMVLFLRHFASLSPHLSCRVLKPGEDAHLDGALDATLLPATGIGCPEGTPRMVFHGVPGGKEITAFASAVLAAGGGLKPLDKATLKDIAKIKNPMVLQVCVSLSCQHCSQLVSNAHRVAWENQLVTAHMIDANLYPDLVKAYDIQRVPLTVIDGKKFVPGGKTMAELTTLLAKYK
jgi:alkyl hydroperoxide reductase subunit AhpF